MAAFASLRRPVLTAATLTTFAGASFYIFRPAPLMLDSPANEPLKTLSFPRTMLSSRTLTVQNVEQINHDTKRITFALPGGQREISGVAPGSAILTQHTSQNSWFLPTMRPYTPISSPSANGTLTLLVKRYPQGTASTHLHSLTPDSTLTVRGPLPGYTYTPSPEKEREVLMLAGGAGITPIFSLLQGILADTGDRTKVRLVWCVNSGADVVLGRELQVLRERFPERLSVVYALSSGESVVDGATGAGVGATEAFGGKVKKGRVDLALLREVSGGLGQGTASWGDARGTKVFLCGPPAMEEALAGKQGVLGQLGVGKKEIHRF